MSLYLSRVSEKGDLLRMSQVSSGKWPVPGLLFFAGNRKIIVKIIKDQMPKERKNKRNWSNYVGEEDFVRRVKDETKEEKLFFALFFTFR